MNTKSKSRQAWSQARKAVRDAGPDTTVRIPKERMPHPRDAGAVPTMTWPVGQTADYCLEGKAGEPPLVIREFASHFEALLEGVRLTNKASAIAQNNPTAAMYVGGALLGGALGTSLSSKREGALLGAGVGILLAAIVDASLEGKRRR